MTRPDPGVGVAAPSLRVSSIAGELDAVVSDVPGSKSVANRALLFAALADGLSCLHNVPDGDDSTAMLDCLRALGIGVASSGAGSIEIAGTGGRLPVGPATLPTRLAGTTSRFVTALAALGPGPYLIDGEAPLRARPMAPLHDALRRLGAHVEAVERPGHLPVVVGRGAIGTVGRVEMPGDVSSQFVSALMMIAPYLQTGLTIDLSTPLVSRPYVEITAVAMAAFGVDDVTVGDRRVRVGVGRYRAGEFHVEADASSASYPLAAAAIVGGRVVVEGLGHTSTQGDARFADALAAMGCRVERTAASTTLERRGPLRGIELDMADISDTVPTLAAVAPFAETATRITGVGFIRHKESDRIGDLAAELRRLGVRVGEESDGMTIYPSTPHGAAVETHHDHRLAMSLALIGLRCPDVIVVEPTVVSKSWPGFWSMIERLAGQAG